MYLKVHNRLGDIFIECSSIISTYLPSKQTKSFIIKNDIDPSLCYHNIIEDGGPQLSGLDYLNSLALYVLQIIDQ